MIKLLSPVAAIMALTTSLVTAAELTLPDGTTTVTHVFTLKDAERIVATSHGNEIRFNRDFKGKEFHDVLVLDTIWAGLVGGYDVNFNEGIHCHIDEVGAKKLIDWDPGKRVKVTGTINTTLLGIIDLRGCEFE